MKGGVVSVNTCLGSGLPVAVLETNLAQSGLIEAGTLQAAWRHKHQSVVATLMLMVCAPSWRAFLGLSAGS